MTKLADAQLMRSIVQRIATGPELSKDISREEAYGGMRQILDGVADPVQAAIFLIALRMKRETDEESRGVLDALLETTETATAGVDEVLNLADPYDGFLRMLPSNPFLPVVLASFGVATVSHGVERMGPKYGVTHRQVLREAGVAVDDNPARAAERLADPEVGFAYCDQARFAPRLHALTELRTRIVKRPLLTTLEVILPPVRGRKGTHLMTGYVHKPYPRIYAFLARHAGFDSALIMRGLEGGVIPSLQKAGRAFHYHDGGDEAHTDIDPVDLQIHSATRSAPLPEDIAATLAAENTPAEQRDTRSLARAACVAGLEALEGKPGPIREGLVFGAAAALWHLKRYPTPAKAAAAVRAGLDSGNIRRRLP